MNINEKINFRYELKQKQARLEAFHDFVNVFLESCVDFLKKQITKEKSLYEKIK